MNRTILIILGLACAVITAVGIIHYNPISVARRNLNNKNPRVRENAMRTLYINIDKQSSQQVRRLLNDDDAKVLVFAMNYLSDFDYKESAPEIRNLLNNKNPAVRGTAIYSLTKLNDKESIPEIRERFNDEHERVRCYAIESLADFGDRESIPEIRKLLNDEEKYVRENSIKALGKLGDKESIPRIKELLKDKEGLVNYFAQEALKALGVPDKEIEEAKIDVIDFTGTVLACGMQKNDEIDIIIGLRFEANWVVRVKVKEANKSHPSIQPGKTVTFLIHSPTQLFHEDREKTVGKDYRFRFSPYRDEKGKVRLLNLKIMDEILKQRPLLHDKDAAVRRKAIDFLSSFRERDEESIPEIRKLLNDDSAEVRRAAVGALFRLGDKESIPEIKKLLNDENEQVRKDAAEALEFFDRLEKHIQKAKDNK